MDLTSYDIILLNSSGGKDSQVMLDHVFWLAINQGVVDRLRVVHADLGRMEWPGVKELAERQAQCYGIPFAVTAYRGTKGKDLLDYVRDRGKWPDSQARYCTSDFKRGPVGNYITELVEEIRAQKGKNYQVRILNCLGIRAQESPRRKKMPFFSSAQKCKLKNHGAKTTCKFDSKLLNSRRHIDTWYPIFDWTESEVWQRIRETGVPYHEAYDKGMPRLSCMFCVFAPPAALEIAGRANPGLLDEYIQVETEIGHTFRKDFSIAQVKAAIEAMPIASGTHRYLEYVTVDKPKRVDDNSHDRANRSLYME